MLCASFTGPHYPYRAPQHYWDLYQDADVDLPALPADYAQREHTYAKWLRRHGQFDRLVPERVCRMARRAILGRITMVDDYIERILALLHETGLEENTIVMYMSDHGDMMGEHGLWFRNAPYEWSSRVPWIVAGPGIRPGRVSEVVSLLDLGPTLCALAGVQPVYGVTDGRDLSGLLLGKRASDKGVAIMENYGEGVWRGYRMIRRGNLKLTCVPGCESELFDLRHDPGEWNNVAGEKRFRRERAELEHILLDGWKPDDCDERRWQSEERRLAILKTGMKVDWQKPSSPVLHPLMLSEESPIDNVCL
jgi:choline-sulfatase